jgi:hypothetical protein
MLQMNLYVTIRYSLNLHATSLTALIVIGLLYGERSRSLRVAQQCECTYRRSAQC